MLISIAFPINVSRMLRLEVIFSPSNLWEERNSLHPFSSANLSRLLFSLSVASKAIIKSSDIASWCVVEGVIVVGFIGWKFLWISGSEWRIGLRVIGAVVICLWLINMELIGISCLLWVMINTKSNVTSFSDYEMSWLWSSSNIAIPLKWEHSSPLICA